VADGLAEAEGLTDALGDTDAEGLTLGLSEGDTEGETEAEPGARVFSSKIRLPKAEADVPPQVIVVPVKPLSRNTYSAPVVGLEYPKSPVEAGSVQLVGGVNPAGLVLLPITPSVGFAVSAAAPKAGAGVPPAA